MISYGITQEGSASQRGEEKGRKREDLGKTDNESNNQLGNDVHLYQPGSLVRA